jgi:hypothetical protein
MGLFSRNKDNNKKPDEQQPAVDEFTQRMIVTAAACVEHFEIRSGGKLDYSEQSLHIVDSILDEAADHYEDMEPEQQKWLVSSFGAYIFEVARRNYGGRYYWYDAGNQPIFVTGQPKFEISIIVFDKVKGRMVNGKEDHIPFFFKGYTERLATAKEGDRATIV